MSPLSVCLRLSLSLSPPFLSRFALCLRISRTLVSKKLLAVPGSLRQFLFFFFSSVSQPSLPACLPACPSLSLSLSVPCSLYLSISFCQSTILSLHLSIYLSIYLSINLAFSFSFSLSFLLFVSRSFVPSPISLSLLCPSRPCSFAWMDLQTCIVSIWESLFSADLACLSVPQSVDLFVSDCEILREYANISKIFVFCISTENRSTLLSIRSNRFRHDRCSTVAESGGERGAGQDGEEEAGVDGLSGQLPPTSTAATSKQPAAHCCATGITSIVVRRDCHCYQHRHVTPRAVRVQASSSSCGWRWWCCCCQPILVTDGAGAAASLVVMLTALVLLVGAGRHRPRLSSFRRCSSSSSLLHGVLPTSRTAIWRECFQFWGGLEVGPTLLPSAIVPKPRALKPYP